MSSPPKVTAAAAPVRGPRWLPAPIISALVFFIIKLPPGDFLTNQIAELQAQGDPSAAVRLSGPSGPIRSCTRTRRRFRNRYRAARLASSGSVSNCCRVQKAADSALGLKLVGS